MSIIYLQINIIQIININLRINKYRINHMTDGMSP